MKVPRESRAAAWHRRGAGGPVGGADAGGEFWIWPRVGAICAPGSFAIDEQPHPAPSFVCSIGGTASYVTASRFGFRSSVHGTCSAYGWGGGGRHAVRRKQPVASQGWWRVWCPGGPGSGRPLRGRLGFRGSVWLLSCRVVRALCVGFPNTYHLSGPQTQECTALRRLRLGSFSTLPSNKESDARVLTIGGCFQRQIVVGLTTKFDGHRRCRRLFQQRPLARNNSSSFFVLSTGGSSSSVLRGSRAMDDLWLLLVAWVAREVAGRQRALGRAASGCWGSWCQRRRTQLRVGAC